MTLLKRLFGGRYGVKRISIGCFAFAALSLVWLLWVMPPTWNKFGPIVTAALFAGYGVWRCLSRNVTRRAQEDYILQMGWQQLKGRMKARKGNKAPRSNKGNVYTTSNPSGATHAIFGCPVCGQSVRVPTGKGKLRITCPNCHHQFQQTT